MKKLNVYLIIILISFLTGCDRNKDSTTKKDVLPPITQEGKNTFGCKVNDEVWVPKGSISVPALTSNYQNNSFSIAVNRSADNEYLYYNGYFTSAGQYSLYDPLQTIFYSKEINGILHQYSTDSDHTGVMTITKLDTSEGIISGTFYFDAIDTVTNEVVHVTDGRFDVKY